MANMVDSTNPDIKRLQNEYLEVKSIHKMAAKYRVNFRYVWDLLVRGKVPTSKKVCKRLGLVMPEKHLSSELTYTRLRNQKLNEIATLKGFSSWCNYCTHLIKEYEECQNTTQ